jgi:transcriptional regulator with XRE-family HTH domain
MHYNDPGDLGRRIYERRMELGLSREEVARRAGTDPGYFAYLEERSGARTGSEVLFHLASALGTTVARLQGEGFGEPVGTGHTTALVDGTGVLLGFEAVGEDAVNLAAWALLLRRSRIGFAHLDDLGIPVFVQPLEYFQGIARSSSTSSSPAAPGSPLYKRELQCAGDPLGSRCRR